MNLREYAEHRTRNGNTCTKQAISKHLPKLRRGGAAVQNGRDWNIDPAKADALLSGTDPTQGKPLGGYSNHAHASARTEGARIETGGNNAGSNANFAVEMKAGTLLLASRAARAHSEAEQAKLDLAKRRGDLVETSEALKIMGQVGRIYAKERAEIPLSLASKLLGKTDPKEIESLLKAALAETDTRISDEIMARFSLLNGSHS